MLLQLGQLNPISFLLDLLRFSRLNRLPVIQAIIGRVHIQVIAALGLALAVEVDLQEASFDLFALHLDKRLLGTLMRLKRHIGEPFRLFGLPVVGDADGFNLTKTPEAITYVILFELIGQVLDE